MITIGPWLLLIVYDLLLFLFRTATYEVPYVGGRARNRPRPRAPSLSERPSGKARRFSLTISGAPTAVDLVQDTKEGFKQRLDRPGHERRSNSSVIVEDEDK